MKVFLMLITWRQGAGQEIRISHPTHSYRSGNTGHVWLRLKRNGWLTAAVPGAMPGTERVCCTRPLANSRIPRRAARQSGTMVARCLVYSINEGGKSDRRKAPALCVCKVINFPTFQQIFTQKSWQRGHNTLFQWQRAIFIPSTYGLSETGKHASEPRK